MAAKDSIGRAGEAARKAQRNRYLQRLIEDEDLRGSLLTAYGAARSVYGRMSNGKPASKAIFEDSKLQRELREAANALRDASSSLKEGPKRRRSRGGLGRSLMLLMIAGALAMVLSEGLRSKVLDLLFGAEEEFDYSSTTAPADRRSGRRSSLLSERPPRLERGGPVESNAGRKPAFPQARRRNASSRRCAAVWRSAALRPRPSSTSPARRASRGDCCTITSAPRSSCSSRRCAATASCAWSGSSTSSPGATTVDDFIDLMAQSLQETVREDPDFVTLVFELFTLSRRNGDIAVEYARLLRLTRRAAGEHAGRRRSATECLRLHAEPEAVADILFSLGDGFALRMLAEPERDFTETMQAGIVCARALLTDRRLPTADGSCAD